MCCVASSRPPLSHARHHIQCESGTAAESSGPTNRTWLEGAGRKRPFPSSPGKLVRSGARNRRRATPSGRLRRTGLRARTPRASMRGTQSTRQARTRRCEPGAESTKVRGTRRGPRADERRPPPRPTLRARSRGTPPRTGHHDSPCGSSVERPAVQQRSPLRWSILPGSSEPHDVHRFRVEGRGFVRLQRLVGQLAVAFCCGIVASNQSPAQRCSMFEGESPSTERPDGGTSPGPRTPRLPAPTSTPLGRSPFRALFAASFRCSTGRPAGAFVCPTT